MILVLNAGSSSVKFAVLDPDSGERALSGELLIARDAARLVARA